MKIIHDGLYGKNIQFTCKCCGCVYEVESRDDWKINFVHPNRAGDLKLLVPDYSATCPNCKFEENLLFDPEDLVNTEAVGTVCTIIPLLKTKRLG